MKKQTKQIKQTVGTCVAGCNTRHKILGLVALVGLFACGLMIGITVGHRSVVVDENTPVVVSESIETEQIDPMYVCHTVENLYKRNLEQRPTLYREFLQNAEIYSELSKRGCPENSAYFKKMAINQIEIVNRLMKENEVLNDEYTEMVVDTYKKLDMKREAQQFLNKMQKLADPAIDFIMQMQAIINE